MNARAWVDPRMERVRVDDVRAYLEAHGWVQKPYPRPELLVFEGPLDDGGEPIVQVLPSSERLADYRLRVEELIASLSVLEDRPAVEVLGDLLSAILANGSRNNGSTEAGAIPATPSSPPRPG